MSRTFESTYFGVRISTHSEALIELKGELDLASVPIFRTALSDLDLLGSRRVVLDLGRLGFIDAAGLHAVLDLHEQCLNASRSLTVLPGPRNVRRVFELSGADQIVSFGRPEPEQRDERRGNDGSR